MSNPTPSIRVSVDVRNPGQFFACCGLLELADRLWPGAEGWFAEREFCIAGAGTLRKLLEAAKAATINGISGEDDSDAEDEAVDEEDDATLTPVELVTPVAMRLDWWSDKSIKTWAGSMNVHCITIAMANAIDPERPDPFYQCEVVYDPQKQDGNKGKRGAGKRKKREPFYFDSRRGPNAHSRDVGFSPNDLKMTTTASPVVEFFCLLGLQRSRPKQTPRPRLFNYFTWTAPLSISILPAAVCGLLPFVVGDGYQFSNDFRSGQKKLKAFSPAIPLFIQGD
jgi:CRISPR-associated protein Csb3